MENHTILEAIKDGVVAFVWWLSEVRPGLPWLVVQLGMTELATIAVVLVTWMHSPVRSKFSQLITAFVTLVVCLNVPLEPLKLENHRGNYALLVVICFIFMLALPRWLSFLLIPDLKGQIRLTKAILVVTLLLFIMQMFA